MPTIHREAGFQFRIFLADHPPPHVHAYKSGHMVKIEIGTARTPSRILSDSSLPVREQVRAVQIVEQHRSSMRKKWREIHG